MVSSSMTTEAGPLRSEARHRSRFTALPSPAELSEYERLVPGTAAQLVELLSLELEGKRQRQQQMLAMEEDRRRTEERFGFLSAMVSVLAAVSGAAMGFFYILHSDKAAPVIAVVASLPAAVGTACTLFLFGQRAGRSNRSAKQVAGAGDRSADKA